MGIKVQETRASARGGGRRREAEAARYAAIRDGVRHLSIDFQALMDAMTPSVRAAGEGLAARIALNRDVAASNWPDQFSPLVLLFPQLQLEAVDMSVDDVRPANCAHLCYLIRAFVEDRVIDGQLALSEAEAVFVDAVAEGGRRRLRRLAPDSAPGLLAAYKEKFYRAQGGRYRRSDGATAGYPELRTTVAARGYMGLVVPLAVHSQLGGAPADTRRIRNAFDCLMLGLQWLDDIVDWREDLAAGDINLLLELLRQRGWDAYRHPADEVREVNVGFALLESEALARAVTHARRWLEAAERRQRQLGCHTVAALIRDRAKVVHQKAAAERHAVEQAVLARIFAGDGVPVS